MSNVMDMLVKLGYEAASIGSNVLPCTLSKEGKPVGFLMQDFSVQLLPEHEAKRDSIMKAVSFSLDYQGLETLQNEFKLTQYQNVVLTATYDYEDEKPVFNIYRLDSDKNLILLNSLDDKAAAAKGFASLSGLVEGNISVPTRETNRIGRFVESIKQKGFFLSTSVEDAFRSYDILDSENHVVGYIGKNNRVTLTAENERVRRTLSDAYAQISTDRELIPGFFDRLKEKLKEIGLALKVIFTRSGQHYTIQNERHQEVATVSENHEVTYTDQATKEQMAKIDAMVEQIKRENLSKEQVLEQEVRQIESRQQTRTEEWEEKTEVAAAIDTQLLISTVLSNPQLTARLVQAVLTNEEILAQLNADLSNQLKGVALVEKQPDQRAEQVISAALSPEEVSISEAFHKDLEMLQTLDGFNQEKYSAMQQQMIVSYGTSDLQEFEQKLQQGDYKAPASLPDKLKVSHKKAGRQNTAVRQARNDHQKEQNTEKERA